VAFVKHAEIDWVEAADYYACLHTGTKTHLLRRTLTELDQELDPRLFCRIHRSAIVNLERVRALELNDESDYRVVLENGTKLRLSRRYRKELQSRLGARVGGTRLAD
jgi:two-component system LytT family response regulator